MQSRRNVLQFALTLFAAPAMRVWAFAKSNFWDEKDPGEWSDSERRKLLSNSPWAKNVSVSMGRGRGSGGPGGGGGGGRGGRGSSAGGGGGGAAGEPPALDLTVTWESAEPMRLARKNTAEMDKSDYLIGVSGFPERAPSGRGSGYGRGFQAGQTGAGNDLAARLQQSAKLEVKDKPALHPGKVERLQGAGQAVLFHFDRGELPITIDNKEVVFTLRLGAMDVTAKFSPKAMVYKDHLSV